MAIIDRVRELVLPIVEGESVELYDIEQSGAVLRISVDHPDGISIDVIKRISRSVSHLFDELDPIPGRYTLEVSSPGLERQLRTPDHFHRAIGSDVKIKTRPDYAGERRIQGPLVAADDGGFEITVEGESRRLSYDDVIKARTVFEWGPTPKPGGPKKNDSSTTPEKKAPTS
jgi:ribosome maturation factor RimP